MNFVPEGSTTQAGKKKNKERGRRFDNGTNQRGERQKERHVKSEKSSRTKPINKMKPGEKVRPIHQKPPKMAELI